MFTDQLKELQKLRDLSDVFIVEGIRDKKALARLGLKNVIGISGKSFYELLEEIKENNFKSVVILSDFDEEGKEKAKTLTKLFQANNIETNSSLRKKIKKIFKIKKVEELNSFTKFLEDDYYGKDCSVYDKILNRSRVLSRRDNRKARCYRSYIWPNRGFVRS